VLGLARAREVIGRGRARSYDELARARARAEPHVQPVALAIAKLGEDLELGVEILARRAQQRDRVEPELGNLRENQQTFASLRSPSGTVKFGTVRPEHGVRYELKLLRSSDRSGEYALRVALAESETAGTAHIDVDTGDVVLGFPDHALSSEMELTLRALLRVLWRGKQSGGNWPRRITRWRGEPAA
jgi:hypothetical protein